MITYDTLILREWHCSTSCKTLEVRWESQWQNRTLLQSLTVNPKSSLKSQKIFLKHLLNSERRHIQSKSSLHVKFSTTAPSTPQFKNLLWCMVCKMLCESPSTKKNKNSTRINICLTPDALLFSELHSLVRMCNITNANVYLKLLSLL